ncbi:MAG: hypothetical protein H8F28_23920 [Fibrella sp.]|nr:hypothetical protein [Armatimonadota bacterium]
MNSESDRGPNEPMEFKILEYEADGFLNSAWFHGSDRLGSDKELEVILNKLGAEGWDIIQFLDATSIKVARIVLRRRAR